MHVCPLSPNPDIQAHTCRIPAGSVEAGDEALHNGVAAGHEHDWYALRALSSALI
jgi:hypothetical protein